MWAALYWRSASVSKTRLRTIVSFSSRRVSSASGATSEGASWAEAGAGAVATGDTSGLLEVLGVGRLDLRHAGQDHAEVVAHRGLGAVSVAGGDRRDELAVLGDHLAEIAGLGEAEPADAVEV